MVDKGITMADLKGTLETFVKALYGEGFGGPVPAPSLPLYRALRRDGRHVLQPPGQGLPPVQRRGLDRDPGLRHGPSQGAANCGIDPEV